MTDDNPIPASTQAPVPVAGAAEDHQAQVNEAFALERGIKEKWVQINSVGWELAADLYAFHEKGAWGLLGYDTLEEFLAQPDLGMSRVQFFRSIQTWRDLVVVRKVSSTTLSTLNPSKVHEVRAAIMRGDVSVDDALEDAKELGQRDLREKYRKGHKKEEPAEPADGSFKGYDDGEASDEGEVEPKLGTESSDGPAEVEADPALIPCPKCGSWVEVGALDAEEGPE